MAGPTNGLIGNSGSVVRSGAEGEANVAEKVGSVCSVGVAGRAVVGNDGTVRAVLIASSAVGGVFRKGSIGTWIIA